MKSFRNVDAFIAASPAEAQPKLRELRNLIRSALPKSEEKIWYGVPFYHECGEIVGLSVSRHHVSVGFGAEVFSVARRKALEKLGYPSGKCTLQIRFDQKIPKSILRRMIKEKLNSNRAKQSTAQGR
jgi:uncharacterized protein YdhG (YjbR/CyaY superfamily)